MITWKVDKDLLDKEILYIASDDNELEEAEIAFVSMYIQHPLNKNGYIPRKGFCSKPGNPGYAANLGKKFSEETKEKMRKPKSEEHRQKLRKILQENRSPGGWRNHDTIRHDWNKGKSWYTDGVKNKLFREDDIIPENFRKGRCK